MGPRPAPAREASRNMAYDHRTIESRWQAWWRENDAFRTPTDRTRPKYYVLDMFPYPSGAGLHVGHPKGYVATDVVARARRMMGFNVLRVMGWDSFGLPAERQAERENRHPREITERNIKTFKQQLSRLGLSYDWSRELATSDPRYYKWTQWIFLQLYDKGLAYQAEVPVNWCPALGTVLANEEVVDGRYVETGDPVERRLMKQWMLRITDYAESLLAGLDTLDWPDGIKAMQREWIGRSEGARFGFEVDGADASFEVFTTRPDTLFGCTYTVLAPEHPLVSRIVAPERAAAVAAYLEDVGKRSERDRASQAVDAPKTGVFTGAYAIHPITGARVPIWIADYVLAHYGTGAVFACPAHDERDHAFALTFGLPIVEVVSGGDDVQLAPFTGDGPHVGSDFLDGLDNAAAIRRVVAWLEERGKGNGTVQYRLRDWLFSRQRYWGEPFPLIELDDGTVRALAVDDLPVLLPQLEEFKPTADGRPPLARAEGWVAVTDPVTGRPARRETNTMPQWAGSCWYYLRFISPDRDDVAWDAAEEAYWMPVDLYVGGAEHAVLHLLYSRFWHKVLFDRGHVSSPEPFARLVNQGMILGEMEFTGYRAAGGGWISADQRGDADTPVRLPAEQVEKQGEHFVLRDMPKVRVESRAYKMSKSRGNVVNPDQIVTDFGADSLRLYEMFMGPLEATKPWSTAGVGGVRSFLERSWRLVVDERADDMALAPQVCDDPPTDDQLRELHRMVDKVTKDIQALSFNTAIARMMEFVNVCTPLERRPRALLEPFVTVLCPFAPHLAEELWELLGKAAPVSLAPWPVVEEQWLRDDTVEIPVQIQGKLRSRIVVPADADAAALQAAAAADPKIAELLAGRTIAKVVAVPGRMVNFVLATSGTKP
jgi:leucyl-tRNA synthetase